MASTFRLSQSTTTTSQFVLIEGKPVSNVEYKDIYGEGAAFVANRFYVLSYQQGKIEE